MLLGGAVLTIYEGEIHYARDAFEDPRLMDSVMSANRGERLRPAAGQRNWPALAAAHSAIDIAGAPVSSATRLLACWGRSTADVSTSRYHPA